MSRWVRKVLGKSPQAPADPSPTRNQRTSSVPRAAISARKHGRVTHVDQSSIDFTADFGEYDEEIQPLWSHFVAARLVSAQEDSLVLVVEVAQAILETSGRAEPPVPAAYAQVDAAVTKLTSTMELPHVVIRELGEYLPVAAVALEDTLGTAPFDHQEPMPVPAELAVLRVLAAASAPLHSTKAFRSLLRLVTSMTAKLKTVQSMGSGTDDSVFVASSFEFLAEGIALCATALCRSAASIPAAASSVTTSLSEALRVARSLSPTPSPVILSLLVILMDSFERLAGSQVKPTVSALLQGAGCEALVRSIERPRAPQMDEAFAVEALDSRSEMVAYIQTHCRVWATSLRVVATCFNEDAQKTALVWDEKGGGARVARCLRWATVELSTSDLDAHHVRDDSVAESQNEQGVASAPLSAAQGSGDEMQPAWGGYATSTFPGTIRGASPSGALEDEGFDAEKTADALRGPAVTAAALLGRAPPLARAPPGVDAAVLALGDAVASVVAAAVGADRSVSDAVAGVDAADSAALDIVSALRSFHMDDVGDVIATPLHAVLCWCLALSVRRAPAALPILWKRNAYHYLVTRVVAVEKESEAAHLASNPMDTKRKEAIAVSLALVVDNAAAGAPFPCTEEVRTLVDIVARSPANNCAFDLACRGLTFLSVRYGARASYALSQTNAVNVLIERGALAAPVVPVVRECADRAALERTGTDGCGDTAGRSDELARVATAVTAALQLEEVAVAALRFGAGEGSAMAGALQMLRFRSTGALGLWIIGRLVAAGRSPEERSVRAALLGAFLDSTSGFVNAAAAAPPPSTAPAPQSSPDAEEGNGVRSELSRSAGASMIRAPARVAVSMMNALRQWLREERRVRLAPGTAMLAWREDRALEGSDTLQAVLLELGALVRIASFLHAAERARDAAADVVAAVVASLATVVCGSERARTHLVEQIGAAQLCKLVKGAFPGQGVPPSIIDPIILDAIVERGDVTPQAPREAAHDPGADEADASADGTVSQRSPVAVVTDSDKQHGVTSDTVQSHAQVPDLPVRCAEFAALAVRLSVYCDVATRCSVLHHLAELAKMSRRNASLFSDAGIVSLVINLHLDPAADRDGDPSEGSAAASASDRSEYGVAADANAALELVEALGRHLMRVADLKALLALARPRRRDPADAPQRSPLVGAVIRSLSVMLAEMGPRSFFDCDGSCSGLALPVLSPFPAKSRGYSVSLWIRIESITDPAGDAAASPYEPRLFAFADEDGCGVEAFLRAGFVAVRVVTRKGAVGEALFTFKPRRLCWHHLFFAHHTPRSPTARSSIRLYVNGRSLHNHPLKYPGIATAVHARIGTNIGVPTAAIASERISAADSAREQTVQATFARASRGASASSVSAVSLSESPLVALRLDTPAGPRVVPQSVFSARGNASHAGEPEREAARRLRRVCALRGQIGPAILFSEAMGAPQAEAIAALGPAFSGTFDPFERVLARAGAAAGTAVSSAGAGGAGSAAPGATLSPLQQSVVTVGESLNAGGGGGGGMGAIGEDGVDAFDGMLRARMLAAFFPLARGRDGSALDVAPHPHAPAQLLAGTRRCTSGTLIDALEGAGGLKVLLPLLAQFAASPGSPPLRGGGDDDVAATLRLFADVIRLSPAAQYFAETHHLADVLAHLLRSVASSARGRRTVEAIMRLVSNAAASQVLQRTLFSRVLCRWSLWTDTPTSVRAEVLDSARSLAETHPRSCIPPLGPLFFAAVAEQEMSIASSRRASIAVAPHSPHSASRKASAEQSAAMVPDALRRAVPGSTAASATALRAAMEALRAAEEFAARENGAAGAMTVLIRHALASPDAPTASHALGRVTALASSARATVAPSDAWNLMSGDAAALAAQLRDLDECTEDDGDTSTSLDDAPHREPLDIDASLMWIVVHAKAEDTRCAAVRAVYARAARASAPSFFRASSASSAAGSASPSSPAFVAPAPQRAVSDGERGDSLLPPASELGQAMASALQTHHYSDATPAALLAAARDARACGAYDHAAAACGVVVVLACGAANAAALEYLAGAIRPSSALAATIAAVASRSPRDIVWWLQPLVALLGRRDVPRRAGDSALTILGALLAQGSDSGRRRERSSGSGDERRSSDRDGRFEIDPQVVFDTVQSLVWDAAERGVLDFASVYRRVVFDATFGAMDSPRGAASLAIAAEALGASPARDVRMPAGAANAPPSLGDGLSDADVLLAVLDACIRAGAFRNRHGGVLPPSAQDSSTYHRAGAPARRAGESMPVTSEQPDEIDGASVGSVPVHTAFGAFGALLRAAWCVVAGHLESTTATDTRAEPQHGDSAPSADPVAAAGLPGSAQAEVAPENDARGDGDEHAAGGTMEGASESAAVPRLQEARKAASLLQVLVDSVLSESELVSPESVALPAASSEGDAVHLSHVGRAAALSASRAYVPEAHSAQLLLVTAAHLAAVSRLFQNAGDERTAGVMTQLLAALRSTFAATNVASSLTATLLPPPAPPAATRKCAAARVAAVAERVRTVCDSSDAAIAAADAYRTWERHAASTGAAAVSREHGRATRANKRHAARDAAALRTWRAIVRSVSHERGVWRDEPAPGSTSPDAHQVLRWRRDRSAGRARTRPLFRRNYAYNDHRDARRLAEERGSESGAEESLDAHEDAAARGARLASLLSGLRRTALGDNDEGLEDLLRSVNAVESASQSTNTAAAVSSSSAGAAVLRSGKATLVRPGRSVQGELVLWRHAIRHSEPVESGGKVRSWPLHLLVELHVRRYLLQHTALELMFADGESAFFVLESRKAMYKLYKRIIALQPPRLRYYSERHKELRLAAATAFWQQRLISNFEYLMELNTLAGRSPNDLAQYPVLPWVLSNYEAERLDLDDPANYRDLSKPVGALNEERLELIQQRYEEFEDPENVVPKFHYGSHYSSEGVVLYYLLRIEPFTTLALELQGGKFDHADRMFFSMRQTWENALTNLSDVKELVPEMFYQPEVLRNDNGFPLGVRAGGKRVDDVELPPWASSADEFVALHRRALESDIVSSMLHRWIDLIFGYSQRGKVAIEACNTFYYLTYEGEVDVDSIPDVHLRAATLEQIRHFGQTPMQLFKRRHNPRAEATGIPRSIRDPAAWEASHIQPFIIRPFSDLAAPPAGEQNPPSVLLLRALPNEAMVAVDSRRRVASVHADASMWEVVDQTVPPKDRPAAEVPPSSYDVTASGVVSVPLAPPETRSGSLGRPFCSLGRFIVSAMHWDATVRVTTVDGKPLQCLAAQRDLVKCVHIAQDGRTLATGAEDTTVLLWDIDEDRSEPVHPVPRLVLFGHDDAISAVHVSSPFGVVLTASRDGTMILYALRKGRYLCSIELPRRCVVDQVFVSKSAHIVAFSSERQSLFVYSLTGRLIASCDTTERPVEILEVPGEDDLICVGQRGTITRRSIITLSIRTRVNCSLPALVSSAAVSIDERFLLLGLDDGAIAFIGVPGGRSGAKKQARRIISDGLYWV